MRTRRTCASARWRSPARGSWRRAWRSCTSCPRSASASSDLLQYELGEIDALALDEREHEQLLAARERLRRVDALRAAAGGAAEAIAPDGDGRSGADGSSGAAESLAGAISQLDALAGVDAKLDALTERAHALAIEAEDLAAGLRDYCDSAATEGLEGSFAALGTGDGGEVTLDALEERLAAIERVTRKHGGSIQAALEHGERSRARQRGAARARRSRWRTRPHSSNRRARRSTATWPRCARHAGGRRRASRRTSAEQLASLAMGDATFEVSFGERDAGPAGGDTVEFLIAPNPGVPAGPLREIASGGELSRVMLAIMSVANASAEDATLVFDEVDAGIGGHTAKAVGARLQELGERRQVLCITHLPQIASLGARHFSIVKDTSAEPTLTTVVQLGEREVVSELVRMLGADSDDTTARRHARDLRRAA